MKRSVHPLICPALLWAGVLCTLPSCGDRGGAPDVTGEWSLSILLNNECAQNVEPIPLSGKLHVSRKGDNRAAVVIAGSQPGCELETSLVRSVLTLVKETICSGGGFFGVTEIVYSAFRLDLDKGEVSWGGAMVYGKESAPSRCRFEIRGQATRLSGT